MPNNWFGDNSAQFFSTVQTEPTFRIVFLSRHRRFQTPQSRRSVVFLRKIPMRAGNSTILSRMFSNTIGFVCADPPSPMGTDWFFLYLGDQAAF